MNNITNREELKEKLINEICHFGDGVMEFETSDINELINWIDDLQNKISQLEIKSNSLNLGIKI